MCRMSGLHAIALVVALTCLGSAPLSAQAPAGQASPDPALLGDWRCDEGEGDVLADSSGRGNDGDIRGAEWVKGRFGTALYFGGRDAYVSVPGVPGLDGSNEMTVSAWVYWEKSGRYPNIISSGNWCPGGFLIFVADNGCSFRMGKPGKGPLLGTDWAETSATLGQVKPGEWVYLTATFRRPTIETYVNGKRVGTATWDYPVGFSGDLQIGTWGNAQACHTGMIDEVRLYKRALSAAEVAAAYAAGAATHAAAGPGEAPYVKIPAPPAQPAFTLENKLTRVALDRRGRVVAFVDKATGQDHCARPPMDFVTIKRAGITYRPSACTYRAGVLDFTFGKSGLTAQVKVTPKDRCFVLEVASVSDPEADEMVFGALAVSPAKRLSGSVAWAADDDFAAAVVPLNLQAEVSLVGGAPRPTFLPRCVRQYGLVGARTALVGSPTKTVREVLKTVVRTEGLPNSPVGGPFALDAEQNRGSYLFATVSEKNVDEWIALGRRGGFDEIHLCPWWWKMGHYEPHPDLFPHGMAGLKQVVTKLHAAGFKVGMHTLTGCIQVDDPWVSPVPDSRLTKDAHFTLAAAVGPDDKFIPTVEKPEGLKTFWSDVSTGNTIQIGEEIIAYKGLAQEPPYGFTDCTRGQWKTRAAAHDKGSGADHLVASYCCYFPDESSTLLDEMAQRIADVFNTCGTDMIYMDGSEGMKTTHAVAKMKRAIFTRLKGQTMVESSSGSWGAWPFHSRVGAWDHPLWGFNRFTDLHCASLEKHSASEMLPGHMGWWVITGPAPDHAEMLPEDMEYFCGKCLGWDYSMSLEGVAAGARPPNARQDEYLTMLGRYERLRLARYFPESVRAKLRTQGEQFRLAQAPDGAWQLRPTDYAAHRITSLTDGTQ
ncbi:LamG domain-containing protein, partial [bacterium]|nr:LamG domain-containing protein [bacterium]